MSAYLGDARKNSVEKAVSIQNTEYAEQSRLAEREYALAYGYVHCTFSISGWKFCEWSVNACRGSDEGWSVITCMT